MIRLIAIVTMHVRILYPDDTDAGTTEIVLTKHVLVVQPAALVILGGILMVAGIWYARRRRKGRSGRPPRPRPLHPVEPTRKTSRKRRFPSRRRRVPTHVDAGGRSFS